MPSCVGAMPSSIGEQSIPSETTPRISRPVSGLGQGRHARTRWGERHEIARLHVADADDDLVLAADPVLTRARQSLSEFGWSRTSRTRATTTPDRPSHGRVDPFDLGALRREELGELLGREVGRDSTRAARSGRPSCRHPGTARGTRTSPSTNRRMSGTPYRTIATRSIPMPEREPRVALGVVAAVLQHLRMHHARRRAARSTRCRTTRHPTPSQTKHDTATWRPARRTGSSPASGAPRSRAEQLARERLERALAGRRTRCPRRPRGPRPGGRPGRASRPGVSRR